MTPYQFSEAQRLCAKGFKLVELYPDSKRPMGDGWNLAGVTTVRRDAGGYGLLLAANGMCSVDVDNEDLTEIGLWRCGFDLSDIRDSGVATSSTRPGSGGRVAFRVPVGSGLRWLKFSSKLHGTILELRAASPNLQDTLPGTVYRSQDGSGPWVQDYAGIFTLDTAPDVPPGLLAWWQRMSDDIDYLRAQQALFVGDGVHLSVSSGDSKLAYASVHRNDFNATHKMTDILEARGYVKARSGRYAPPTATGAASVRLIPGHDDLWQSDHASDPLWGTFDTWTAHVVLEHGGDLSAAESAAEKTRQIVAVDGFEDCPVAVQVAGTGGLVEADVTLPTFERNKSGKVLAVVVNLLLAIPREDIIGFKVAIDKFKDELMIAPSGSTLWRPFSDTDYTWIQARLETGMNGFLPIQKDLLKAAIKAVAKTNMFDSAQDWLNGLEWDGVPRVEEFFTKYFGMADTPYHRAAALYTFTAMAGRVLSPGCKADMMPIFSGGQGTKKTSFIKALVPDEVFYAEISFHESDDNMARKMRGKFVGEVAELDGFGTKAVEGVKAYMSRTHEEWIPKYQEFPTSYPRRSICIGTTNDNEFLGDKTGNRRFLPMTVGEIDIPGIKLVIEKVWAEAREMFKITGVRWADAERLAKEIHHEYEFTDSWKNVVFNWLKSSDFDGTPNSARVNITSTEILIEALNFEAKNILRRDETRIGFVMRDLGYKKTRVRVHGMLKNVYVLA